MPKLKVLVTQFCPTWAFLVAQSVKNLPAVQETGVRTLGWEDPLEKKMATSPVSLPGKSHGQRNLVGYSPWGYKSLDVTLVTKPFLK